MGKLIYVADDDTHIRKLICSFLRKDGFDEVGFESCEALMEAFAQREPDLVVLDIMMPAQHGLTTCTAIRQISSVPILFVSSRDSELDRITGITLGGDDYMVKPFSPLEMMVRIKALLRRVEMNRPESDQQTLSYGDLSLDLKRRDAQLNGELFPATPTEFDFLSYMMQHQERAISKSELLRELWHFDFDVDTRATDDLVKRLRKKLSSQGSRVKIETVWGFGFRLGEDGSRAP